MNSKRHAGLFYILNLMIFVGGCCHNGNPDIENRELKLEIIPFNQVEINWDSTVYQHTTDWITHIDSAAVDSIAQTLNKSSLLIEEMWYPNENTRCAAPTITGSEVIIKLKAPDPRIYKFGFQKNRKGFPINCFTNWRHYKFTDY